MGPPHLRLLAVFDEQLIMGASWQLIRLRMTVGSLSFPLHGLMTSRYRGESAVCLPSGRRGIAPLIRSSVIKLLCHVSPVFPRFRVNGSHLFQPWANPYYAGFCRNMLQISIRAVLPKGCQFTRCRWKKSDGKQFFQASKRQVPPFSANSHPSM